MNGRIEQMMADASGGACYDGNQLALYGEDIEKFAELIVLECANRLRTEMEQYDMMPGREISAQTMETAQVLIKNHFGVEE